MYGGDGEAGCGSFGDAAAVNKMQRLNDGYRVKGVAAGLISGLTYGIFTTLVLLATRCRPLAGAAGLLAAPYVCSGLNDLLAGLWLTIYNLKYGRIRELGRSLKTFPGRMVVLGSLLGGPVANGAYLVGLAMAGAYAIPISATCSLFGALFAWIFLKQRPTKRVILGMLLCVAGAIVINWTRPEGSPNFTLGLIFALLAAVCWGLEGVISSYGGSLLDSDVAVNLRELISGIVTLGIILPALSAMPLLGETLAAVKPVLWLAVAGLSAAVSFLSWYRSNAMVGCAVGMSLNITYAFWGVLFCIVFLSYAITANIIVGSLVIIIGAVTVTMNPLDLFRKKER